MLRLYSAGALVLLLTTLTGWAQAPAPAPKPGTAAELKHYEVTVRRFDPAQGADRGEDFVLPVRSVDAEHAISSTLANAISWTTKQEGGRVLSVAFRCLKIEEK